MGKEEFPTSSNGKDYFFIIVAGGRDFNNDALMECKLNCYLREKSLTHNIVII